MQPTQVREPFHREGWVYEEKYDGWRIVAYKDGRRVRLVSRNDVDHARRFGDIVAAAAALADETVVLDGEVTIFDKELRSRFDLLRQADPSIVATPAVFIAFDVLYRAGRDLTQTPLIERRLNLEDVVTGHDLVLPARRLAANGFAAWAQVLERGYEGMVGKDETSPYRGGITRSWLKVKVPGWTDPEQSMAPCATSAVSLVVVPGRSRRCPRCCHTVLTRDADARGQRCAFTEDRG